MSSHQAARCHACSIARGASAGTASPGASPAADETCAGDCCAAAAGGGCVCATAGPASTHIQRNLSVHRHVKSMNRPLRFNKSPVRLALLAITAFVLGHFANEYATTSRSSRQYLLHGTPDPGRPGSPACRHRRHRPAPRAADARAAADAAPTAASNAAAAAAAAHHAAVVAAIAAAAAAAVAASTAGVAALTAVAATAAAAAATVAAKPGHGSQAQDCDSPGSRDC